MTGYREKVEKSIEALDIYELNDGVLGQIKDEDTCHGKVVHKQTSSSEIRWMTWGGEEAGRED